MIILSIRTDKPEAEIGLFKDGYELAYETWTAHRQLAEKIHIKIREVLSNQRLDFVDIAGIACYKGPGSFTGLRIGITVGNALADSLEVPIVGESGDDWLKSANRRLDSREDERAIKPEYGRDPHITKQKK